MDGSLRRGDRLEHALICSYVPILTLACTATATLPRSPSYARSRRIKFSFSPFLSRLRVRLQMLEMDIVFLPRASVLTGDF